MEQAMNRHLKLRTAGLASRLAAALAVQWGASVATAAAAPDVAASSPTPTVQPALHAYAAHLRAVKIVSPTHLRVSDGNAQGELALYASADLTQPQP
jgi:hypothetical protein